MSRPITKPGAHGTLYLYVVTYTDRWDPAVGEFEWRTWAYNIDHAVERFYENDDGWTALRVARVLDGISQHRAIQHDVRGYR